MIKLLDNAEKGNGTRIYTDKRRRGLNADFRDLLQAFGKNASIGNITE
jgi:hypothetical protein